LVVADCLPAQPLCLLRVAPGAHALMLAAQHPAAELQTKLEAAVAELQEERRLRGRAEPGGGRTREQEEAEAAVVAQIACMQAEAATGWFGKLDCPII